MATKAKIADFIKKTDFDSKLKDLNIKVNSNKAKHVEVDKKLDDLKKKVDMIRKRIWFFVRYKMYFTGNDDYLNFSVFAPNA